MSEPRDMASDSLYYRFARLKAIREEEQRRSKPEPFQARAQSLGPHETWRNNAEGELWRDRQLDYTRQYIAEYQTDPVDQDCPPIAEEDSGSLSSVHGTKPNTLDPESMEGYVLHRVNVLRGRRLTKKTPSVFSDRSSPSTAKPTSIKAPPPVPPSTAADFDLTSTIMPPSELLSDEYPSNVDIDDLRKRYFSKYKMNTDLPVFKKREQIINSINSYSVVIIEGATGCGKTTQVPMYILEDAVFSGQNKHAPVIYVTQPRRIAARSIADRVSSEHEWELGTLVGYQIGLEKVVSPDTVLVFCTAGVLLQKIIQDKSLKNYTHIIIDEAHERDADTDLLMMMIRKLMLQEMSLFRLIIMSATMNIEKLKDYYTFKTKYGHHSRIIPSHIKASEEKSPTNIQVIYFDHLKQTFKVEEDIPVFDSAEPDLKDGCLNAAVEIIVHVIPKMETYTERSKSTLVFLPGLAEISKLDRKLRQCPSSDDSLDIFPLHSTLASIDQLKIFKPARPGCRKVILATNIAESSITLSDVGFIVDFCLTKILMKDNLTRFPTLRLQWATNDKCTQRAGRTGRCCAGRVFRMVTSSFYKSFKAYAEPELLTAPLELSALRVKNFGMGEIAALLAVVLDPPPYYEVQTAVLELKQIGALSATYRGKLSDIDGDLTELGRIISTLPIDVHLSKLIVLASVFDVLEDAIVVAACLSTNKSVVRYLYGDDGAHLESYETRLDWAKGLESDLFVSLECYKEFRSHKQDRGKSDSWLASWCHKNFLDERKLHDVDALVTEIKGRLEGLNIYTESQQDRPNIDRDPNMDCLMLKVAFCAAFYPNYFLTQKLDAQQVQKELGGLDPTRTVIMSNIPINQVPLYRTQILDQLSEHIGGDMDYIADCSRAMLVLKDESKLSSEGSSKLAEALEKSTYRVLEDKREIPKAMFLALKLADNMGQDMIMVREYKERAAMERMEYYEEQRDRLRKQLAPRLLPSKTMVVDRPADNRRLLEATDEQYVELTDRDYYVEVELNNDQDIFDANGLAELEEAEFSGHVDPNHPIFKPGSRRIRGPNSPIRMAFRSVLVKSRGFCVEVDHQSVNSILLDPDYEKDRRQMLVAASVSQTTRGRVMARDTTLMPNIRGLPSLMTLLFAQYYRLVYNERMNCIAGAIFGIGWDAQDMPIDRNYEVILGFDVHITPDDMALINRARATISELLKFTEILNAGKPQAQLQEELRKIVLTLMRKRRYPLEELDVSMIYYPTSEIEDDNIFIKDVHNLPCDTIDEDQTRSFLPLAEFTRQYQELALYALVRDNLEQLERIDKGESMPMGGVRCLMCGNGGRLHRFSMCSNLYTHLRSAEHLAKLAEFEVFETRALQAQAALDQQENSE